MGISGLFLARALRHGESNRAQRTAFHWCLTPHVERRFFAPAAGDLSGFVYEEVFGAESYEASYGINFLAPSFRFAI